MPDGQGSESDTVFALHEIAAAFPDAADTLLLDRYLVRNEAASARVFRVYRGTPAHYHARCDEFLYVISGRGTFWIGEPVHNGEFRPGHLLAFTRGTVHAMPEVLEEPVVFLAVDVPHRDPADIIFVGAEQGTRGSFISELKMR